MPGSIEERVAFLEGKVEEHSHGFGEVRDLLVQVQGSVLAVDRKVDRFREELASRIDSQGTRIDTLDHRFSALDHRIDAVGARFDALDQKVDRFREELGSRMDSQGTQTDARIDALDQKVSHQFVWIVGIQITVLVSVIGAMLLD